MLLYQIFHLHLIYHLVNHEWCEVTLLQETSDGMAHLYSRLEKLVHGVQKVGHPWSKTMSSNYRPVVCMWPATVFSKALGSIQEKFSNLIFVEKRVRSWIKCIFTRGIHFQCTSLFYAFISDQIRRFRVLH